MRFVSGPAPPVYLAVAVLLFTLLTPEVRLWFQNQGSRWVYILLCASSLSAFITPLLIRLAPLLGAMDLPGGRKIHSAPTPRLGGLAIYSGFMIAVFSNAIFTEDLIVILVAGTLLLVVGAVDDIRPVPATIKLGAQLAATTLVIVFSGKFLTLFRPGPVGMVIDLLLTYLWVVGITNAFNFFDGMDGLATGLAIIIAFFMGVVAFQTHQPILGWLSVAIMGSSLGFLPYNFRPRAPAVIFLGDGGSTFLGFTLACLAVKGNWADNNPIVSLSNPLLIFGVLVYDMVHTTIERILTSKVRTFKEWIDFVGQDHLHHRLARALGSRRESVLMIFLLSICLSLAALALRNARTEEALLLVLQAVLIVLLITLMEHRGRPNKKNTSSL